MHYFASFFRTYRSSQNKMAVHSARGRSKFKRTHCLQYVSSSAEEINIENGIMTHFLPKNDFDSENSSKNHRGQGEGSTDMPHLGNSELVALNLGLFPISTKPSSTKTYQNLPETSSFLPGETALNDNTMDILPNGFNSVAGQLTNFNPT